MATSDSILGNLSGKLGSVICYRMRGSEKMIVRSKGYISPYTRKNHRRYERTRQENNEFKGCVKAAKNLSRILIPVASLGDFNFFGHLVKIAKMMQQVDTELPKGKRSVLISKTPSLLTGFSFNKFNTFEALVKSPISFSIDRPQGTAHFSVPPMQPGIHLLNPGQQPYYRLVFTIGCVADLHLTENVHSYESRDNEFPYCAVQLTDWLNWKDSFPGSELTVSSPRWVDLPNRTLVAGIGISFGKQLADGTIKPVKYAGAGKIWMAM